MKEGIDIIKANPHSLFDRLLERGYQIYYKQGGEEGFRDLVVEVRNGEKTIARADFGDSGHEAHCQNVKVVAEFRRQGIANAMYVFAEKVLGKELSNFWEDDPFQSGGAKYLWSQPKRPFGPQK